MPKWQIGWGANQVKGGLLKLGPHSAVSYQSLDIVRATRKQQLCCKHRLNNILRSLA
jgi:hypothetical protein